MKDTNCVRRHSVVISAPAIIKPLVREPGISLPTSPRFYSPEEIEAPMPSDAIPLQDLAYMKETMRWIREFIMRPHPSLGRTGVVCPYVKTSIDESIFFLTVAYPEDPSNYSQIMSALETCRTRFLTVEPTSGPLSILRVLLILFPHAVEKDLELPLESKRMKSEMMEAGVTVGQFFPTEDIDKFLKSRFFPVQPPMCLYTMRQFIETDWMFIHREPEWRAIYLKRFGKPPELKPR